MKTTSIAILLALCSLTATGRDYDITRYGAVSDTLRLSTEAVQQAIDECSAQGGGRVVVPTGSYKIGTIVLRSGVDLHLERGATLYGSTSLSDYRPMRTSYVSLRTHTPTVQLIYADSATNISISGAGVIDGRGRTFAKLSWNDEGITRPHLLRLIRCSDVSVSGVTLRNSGCWMQHYLACDRLRISDIFVVNRNNYNNDALDLDGCHDVVVEGMVADSDDDAITLKSTSPRLCENIRIANCVVSSHCNAIKLGTETTGGFRNISIAGIVVKPSYDQREKFFGQWRGSSAISLEIVDGGVMENVSVSDITVEGTESPIFVRLGNRGRGYLADALDTARAVRVGHVGSIDGVSLSNIRISHAGNLGCSITGLPGHRVANVRLSNITLRHSGGIAQADLAAIRQSLTDEKERDYPEATMWGCLPAKGFYVRHARGIHFDNISVVTDQADVRPDIVSDDVAE